MRAPTDFLFPGPHACAGVAAHCATVCGLLHQQVLCAQTVVKTCKWHETSHAGRQQASRSVLLCTV